MWQGHRGAEEDGPSVRTLTIQCRGWRFEDALVDLERKDLALPLPRLRRLGAGEGGGVSLGKTWGRGSPSGQGEAHFGFHQPKQREGCDWPWIEWRVRVAETRTDPS